MSATLLHHGHIRLLKKAAEYGEVVVGLTTDEEVLNKKGYIPELNYEQRKEILEGIKYVKEVVPTSWKLDNTTLLKYNIDFLVHGDDNSNIVDKEKLIIFPRTENVCSSELRRKSANIANKVKRNVLLNPGPATTTDTVKFAQVVPDICPRVKEFGDLMEYVSTALTSFVASSETHATVLFSGSGTAAVESILTSVIPYDKTALIINNGAYGKRLCQIVQRYKINHVEFKGSAVEPINLKKLECVIQSHQNLCYLVVVHNETTTGLLNNLNDLGKLAKKYNLMLIVDAMSSYAALPIDMEKQNIAFLAASSNKNIQGMAGVSFVISSKAKLESLKKIEPRTFYLSLYDQYESFLTTHQMRFTPPVQTLYALRQAVVETKKEGIEKRYLRYSNSWRLLTQELKNMGLTYLVDDANHSKIVTSVHLPMDIEFRALHDYFYQQGFTIYPGKVEEFNTFRIANIGSIDSLDIKRFCELLKMYIAMYI